MEQSIPPSGPASGPGQNTDQNFDSDRSGLTDDLSVHRHSRDKAWYAVFTIIIVLLAAAVVFLLVKQQKPPELTGPIDNHQVSLSDNPYALPSEQIPPPPPDASQFPEQRVTVSWQKTWTNLDPKCVQPQDCEIRKVQAGKILSGPYAGKVVYIQIEQGMGASYRHYIDDNGSQLFLADNNIKIEGIDTIADTISWAGTNYKLQKGYVGFAFKDIKLGKKLFTDPVLGDFYLSQEGCLVVELPDHTAIAYNPILPFIDKDSLALNATFTKGGKTSDAYKYTRPTCIALCIYLNTVDEQTLKPLQRIIEAGTLSNGETIYELKDPNDQALKDLYNDENTLAYFKDPSSGDYNKQPQSRYTYSQFIAYHPLVYWKDPLDRWVEFKNVRFDSAAEMCKPVIYLYPTKPTDLHVEVAPNGGFTLTEPQYNNGWNVRAYPNGSLTDKASGKNYDYLFWEGIGLQYPSHADGFVIAKKDLSAFLTAKLTLLGLRGQELADFKEYWVNRLGAMPQPYFKISFLTRDEFNGIAPLSVKPQHPDTIIRIMMTAQGLDGFQSIPEQALTPAPARTGFTLVEWGGAVLQ